jgi:hypothetical protein
MTASDKNDIANEVIQNIRSMSEPDAVDNATFHEDLFETRLKRLSKRVVGGQDPEHAVTDPTFAATMISVAKFALDGLRSEGIHPLVTLSKTVLHGDDIDRKAAWALLKHFVI